MPDPSIVEVAQAVTTTAGGAGNAGKLIKLDGDGKVDGRDLASVATAAAVVAAQATADAAIPKSTVTTADDLIVGTGNGTVARLGMAANRIPLKAGAGLIAATAAQLDTFLAASLTGGAVATSADQAESGIVTIFQTVAGTANIDFTMVRRMQWVNAIWMPFTGSSSFRIWRGAGGFTALSPITNWTADGQVDIFRGIAITRAQTIFEIGNVLRVVGAAAASSGLVCHIMRPIA